MLAVRCGRVDDTQAAREQLSVDELGRILGVHNRNEKDIDKGQKKWTPASDHGTKVRREQGSLAVKAAVARYLQTCS